MRLPVLMFDFGNVVCHFDYGIMYDKFGPNLGLTGTQYEALLREKRIPALAMEFERGGITHESFMSTVISRAGLEMSHEEFEACWVDIFWLNEPVARLIVELKRAGYTLLLGSNTNFLHARFYRRRFAEILDLFDHFVFSHEVLSLKPDRGFFRACVDQVGVPADSCIFIDDVLENVEGARAAGLRAIQFKGTPGLIDALRAHGVEVPDAQA